MSLLLLFCCVPAHAGDTVEVTGMLGTSKTTFLAQEVTKEGKFTVKGPADYLAVTEIYPESSEQITYKYRISGSGIGSYERSYVSHGFGPTTYFLRVRNGSLGAIKIKNHSNGSKSRPVLIGSIWAIKASELDSAHEWDRFTILGLVPYDKPEERDSWAEMLAKNVISRPEDHIGVGFSAVLSYNATDTNSLKQQCGAWAELAKKHKLPALIDLVSGNPEAGDVAQPGLKRLDEAVGDLKAASGGSANWIRGICIEGSQETIDILNKAIQSHNFAQSVPVYAHSPIVANPSTSNGGPPSGARSGVVTSTGRPSDLGSVREWGPWSRLCRDAKGGQDKDELLWTIRVAYIGGADLYSNCGWVASGQQKYFDCVKEFLADLPVVSLPPAEARLVDKRSLKIKAPGKLQAFSRVEIPVKVSRKIAGAAFLCVAFGDGTVFASQQQPVLLAPGSQTLGIDFTTPAECPSGQEALLVLYVFDAKGKMALNSVSMTTDSATGIKLILDLKTQRALSLAIINRRAK